MATRTCLVLLLLTAALVLACGGSAAKVPTSPTPVATLPALATPTRVLPTLAAGTTPLASMTPPMSRAPRAITTADDNHTIVVSVGDDLILMLDTGFDWSGFEVSDPAVLQATAGAALPASAQGMYHAARAGEATLSATGTVHCAPNVACPQLARLFRATIRVRG